MTRIPLEDQENAQDLAPPLTAEQVRELRRHQPLLSVWRVVLAQCFVGLLVTGVAWGVSGYVVAVSVVYGALAVIIQRLCLRGV